MATISWVTKDILGRFRAELAQRRKEVVYNLEKVAVDSWHHDKWVGELEILGNLEARIIYQLYLRDCGVDASTKVDTFI